MKKQRKRPKTPQRKPLPNFELPKVRRDSVLDRWVATGWWTLGESVSGKPLLIMLNKRIWPR